MKTCKTGLVNCDECCVRERKLFGSAGERFLIVGRIEEAILVGVNT